MKRFNNKILSLIILVLFLITISSFSGNKESIVVSTSMLESAALELIPASQEIDIIRLLPPTSCPGHFDLSPRVIPVLRSAVMVVRHDYQDVLEYKMDCIGAKNIPTLKISTTGSPLIPDNYYTLVVQIASLLSREFPESGEEITNAQERVKSQTGALTETMKTRAAAWKGIPIIAAVNLKEFCEWLGFDIVGVIKRPENTSPRDLEQLMGVKAEMVVANLQEGMQGAVSLSEKLDIPVAVLSNFPGADGYGTSYYQLADENLNRLGEAWQRRLLSLVR